MKIFRLLFVLSLLTCSFINAQQSTAKFKLRGGIADVATLKPLSGASVIVLSKATNKQIAGTATDTTGDFTIENIPEEVVRVRLSMVGYKT